MLQWLDDLRCQAELLLNYEEAGVVLLGARVVGARAYGYNLVLSEVIDAILAVLIAPDNHAEVVALEEALYHVGAKGTHSVLVERIP